MGVSDLPDSTFYIVIFLSIEWFNFVKKYNYDILERNAEERPDGVPLVTVCNHTSCLDDPCLWGKACINSYTVLAVSINENQSLITNQYNQ